MPFLIPKLQYLTALATLFSCLAHRDVAGQGSKGQRSEDQVWLKEILDPEKYDYNTASNPFEDLPVEDEPRTLVCAEKASSSEKIQASFSHNTTLPASTATLVVALDLIPNTDKLGRNKTYPLTLCSPEVCRLNKGDLVQLIVHGKRVSLLVRLGSQKIRRVVGTVSPHRATRVFFAVMQHKVVFRKENGKTRQVPLQPPETTRRFPYRTVFCGLEFTKVSFRGLITNAMINYNQVLFTEWQTQDILHPPVKLGTYSRQNEYELSHAAVSCPGRHINHLVFELQNLKPSFQRRKDMALLYVPYETRHQQTEGQGWGVTFTRKNIYFCYDILYREGCDGFQPPLALLGNLHNVTISVVHGLLTMKIIASGRVTRKVSLRQYAKPLPCSNKIYLGSLPDYLPRKIRRGYEPFEGRIGHIKINKDIEINPKTYVERNPSRISENVVMYTLPAMSVRGGPAQYIERPIHKGSNTYAACPMGVKGDWYDLSGRIVTRGKEIIKIKFTKGERYIERVYGCATRHPKLGYRVHTVTAIYYKTRAAYEAGEGRLLEIESFVSFQLDFAITWTVILVGVAYAIFLHTAVSWTRAPRHQRRGERRASVISFLKIYNQEYAWHRAHLKRRNMYAFVYQIYAMHQRILARLTSEDRKMKGESFKRRREKVDLEKLLEEGPLYESQKTQTKGKEQSNRYLPTLPSPLLAYPKNYCRIAEQLMVKKEARQRPTPQAKAPTPSTLSPGYYE
ncbi:hypothetical protein E2C01_033323 [Portunus trituberculatus]|uniref:Uncharacterized protein n=1 Tax=Portunus trituberculatus TaxID=210409 RepID=A0A5B7F585_PORTR|nr:hypothetical protein [Portunus trituberculatus]